MQIKMGSLESGYYGSWIILYVSYLKYRSDSDQTYERVRTSQQLPTLSKQIKNNAHSI